LLFGRRKTKSDRSIDLSRSRIRLAVLDYFNKARSTKIKINGIKEDKITCLYNANHCFLDGLGEKKRYILHLREMLRISSLSKNRLIGEAGNEEILGARTVRRLHFGSKDSKNISCRSGQRNASADATNETAEAVEVAAVAAGVVAEVACTATLCPLARPRTMLRTSEAANWYRLQHSRATSVHFLLTSPTTNQRRKHYSL